MSYLLDYKHSREPSGCFISLDLRPIMFYGDRKIALFMCQGFPVCSFLVTLFILRTLTGFLSLHANNLLSSIGPFFKKCSFWQSRNGIVRAERDGTLAETRFRLSPKRTSPFKSVGASVQSTAGSRVVRISLSNVGYTTFGGGVRVLATHSIRQFPLHFPSRASPCATTFRSSSSTWLFPTGV